MAFVRVEQRNAHLAGAVRLLTVEGRDGHVSKATLTAISNIRRGTGEDRSEQSTAVQWTLWGKQAENAAAYLGKGSHVNVVGRMHNNNYQDGRGTDVYAFDFVCEEIDYLDSRAEAEARQARREEGTPLAEGEGTPPAAAPAVRSRRARAAGPQQGNAG